METDDTSKHSQSNPTSKPQRKAGLTVLSVLLTILAFALVALSVLLGLQRVGLLEDLPLIEKLAAALRTEPEGSPKAGEPVASAGSGGPLKSREADAEISLAPLPTGMVRVGAGISRRLNLDTFIPQGARTEVVTYTVETGDNLFAIAEIFGLKPETLLWGNFEVLQDNPHILAKDQVLNILPVDGVYYQWQNGDTLEGVAAKFNTDPWAIAGFMGNNIDLTVMDQPNSGVKPGTWIIVPGGTRPIKDWGPPAITRSNPASARFYGEGHCGSVYEGAIGTGTFVWPTPSHSISGYTYNSGVHPAIDLAGGMGDAVVASDGGVVVYAGWSNFGYGYLIVIDHGNGWQTAYAHLSSVGVACGQSVFQGGFIGGLGSTGNSSGPHLHFEMITNGAKVNPVNYLP